MYYTFKKNTPWLVLRNTIFAFVNDQRVLLQISFQGCDFFFRGIAQISGDTLSTKSDEYNTFLDP